MDALARADISNFYSHAQEEVLTLQAKMSSLSSLDISAPMQARTRKDSAGVDIEASRVRRRNRQIFQCLECRRRKLKCDKRAPCSNCLQSARDCRYLAPAKDVRGQRRLAEAKDQMSALEQNLERTHSMAGDVSAVERVFSNSSNPDPIVLRRDSANELLGVEILESTPLAALDNVYGDNVDDEYMDLGVQLGKLRLTERVGGWIRFRLVEELNSTLLGVSGSKDLMADTLERLDRDTRPLHRSQTKSFIGPGPDYIPPSPSLYFPATHPRPSLNDHLPTKRVADLLKARYAVAVHPIARTVHWPTFEAQWGRFWTSTSVESGAASEVRAIIFAAMFSAAVSMSDAAVMGDFDMTKAALVSQLRSGTEISLARANFLLTTRLDTMQAFVMYLIPMVRSEVSRAHSALVGTAIRLAKCIGLHRDGSHYAMTAVEVQVRRLIWHQLCFLDLRTCEATGPSLDIRPDETDVQYPLNVDDRDLMGSPTIIPRDKTHWTDVTLFKIRAELTAVRRNLWADTVQIERNQKSLTEVLINIQRLSQNMRSAYGAMLDDQVPVQFAAKCVMEIGISGWFVQILHRYITSTSTPMPDRLRQMLISNGLKQIQNAITLETRSELSPWSWYRGALHQYHVAILLIREVYTHPDREDAAMIWKYLDYIFELPPFLAARDKGELIITDLRDRMATYYALRKVRVPTRIEERASSLDSSGVSSPAQRQQALPLQVENALSTSSHGVAGESSGILGTIDVPNQSLRDPTDFRLLWPLLEASQGGMVDSDRQGIGPSDIDTRLVLDDIDWAELDKYFPVEQYPVDFPSTEWLSGLNTATGQ